MTRLVYISLWLAAASAASAGTVSTVGPGIEVLTQGLAEHSVRICLIPDVQNYCTSSVGAAVTPDNPSGLQSLATAAELAEGPRQLDLLVADIIAEQPDFCIQLGDIGDQAGSNVADSSDADNFLTNAAKWSEYTCHKAHLFDKLDAAGIPWIANYGNHDSYRDVERAFPRAEFLARSYAIAAQNEADRWHVGYSDTEQRAALFQTGIGPICVVTGDYTLDPTGGTLDIDFVNDNIGCGGDYPTIYSSHASVSGTAFNLSANRELFMLAYGHYLAGALQVYDVTAIGGFKYLSLYTNGQESSLSCGVNVAQLERRIHTGTGNWTMAQIVPSLNRFAVQTRNALSRSWQTHPCGYASLGLVGSFAPTFCARFPDAMGCDPTLLPDVTAPTAPSSVAAPNLGQNAIGLTWVASTDAVGVVQYLVERCTGAACSPTIETGAVPGDTLAHSSTGLAVSTTYGFRTRARDGSGNNSAYSSTIYAATTADVTPPTTPSITSVTALGASIRILWSPSTDTSGIDYYEMDRCVGVACADFALLATIDFGHPLAYIDSDSIVSGTSYSYRVRAFDNSGNAGSYSATGTLVFP